MRARGRVTVVTQSRRKVRGWQPRHGLVAPVAEEADELHALA